MLFLDWVVKNYDRNCFTSSELFELYKAWRVSATIEEQNELFYRPVENITAFGMFVNRKEGVRRYHSNGTHYSIDPGLA